MTQNLLIVRGCHAKHWYPAFRYNNDMSRSLWIDVVKRKTLIILIDDFRRDLFGNDLVKNGRSRQVDRWLSTLLRCHRERIWAERTLEQGPSSSLEGEAGQVIDRVLCPKSKSGPADDECHAKRDADCGDVVFFPSSARIVVQDGNFRG
ncbi:unnamed protein product [Chondrus crispus]|uniref:Uncharacterized protein n=1 Tax=Chondrus crispus TaxID=2769 RepID=R7Q125_CHOCR|nr:unnamed protein product [Chondrus crispus]CDF32337.1 unnamed protein product [Chondrus crispus]|eukprot:XP_005712002.1 unnamed protein product [Chondrus crispus]